ncbi:MAG: MotA/TolQ/ExbB proton channel family protein, partial [Pseudomonadota bacterium]
MDHQLPHPLLRFSSRPVVAGMLAAALVCTTLSAAPARAQTPAAPATLAQPQAAATAGAAIAPTAAPGSKKPSETTDNPYGIEALWKGSDLIARFVLVLLAIMSIGSWYIMVTKLLEQSRTARQASTMNKAFWSAGTVREGAGTLEKSSPYRFIAESGAEAISQHTGLKSHIPMNDWVPMSIQAAVDRVQAKAQGGLAFLATVGSTSPFVGLFGTVWGIYHALTAIG